MLNCKNFGNKAEFNVLKLLLKTDRNKPDKRNERAKKQSKRNPKEIHNEHTGRNKKQGKLTIIISRPPNIPLCQDLFFL